jgi:hypothetical protein
VKDLLERILVAELLPLLSEGLVLVRDEYYEYQGARDA